MATLGNLLGYQAVWFLAVYGAGSERSWPAIAAAGVFAAWQLGRARERGADLSLVGVALLLGVLLDGALARSGWLRYAASTPALPPRGAPLWILALWVAFALTLNHSLRVFARRPAAAALLGFLGGPLSYLAAARLTGAVQFAAPPWRGMAALAVGWAAALALLALLARPERPQPPAAAGETR